LLFVAIQLFNNALEVIDKNSGFSEGMPSSVFSEVGTDNA